MRKIFFLLLFLFISLPNVGAYCYDNSYYIQSQITSKKNEIANAQVQLWNAGGLISSNGQTAISNLNNELNTLQNQLRKTKNDYQYCLENETKQANLSDIFNKGYNSYNNGNYQDAISYFSQYLQLNNDSSDVDYKSAKKNLILSYKEFAGVFFDKKDFNNALSNYKNASNLDNTDSNTLTNIGVCYHNLGDYSNALINYQDAYKYATDTFSINDIQERIDSVKLEISNQELKKSAPTNDIYSGYQYYLKQLNIPNTWEKVTNKNQVIVAVIDDGININHPDLVNSIWINPKAKYGDSKIIDFVGDGMPANLPVGEHGTMIAGIIGATRNNNEGIAGIANNVKLMPLRVFDTNGGAKEENIIKAINYAIDNGANIINLSLGFNQFSYNTKFDEIIKKAYEKGVVVVIASGNGDLLTGQETGINLTNNPISPVCNNEGKYKYSIGVYATDEDGYRTNWTNYGNCADFFAPGVGIVSTSIPAFNSNYGTNYNALDGTSFSAPIISGIIALGYNQFGYIDPITVYDSLLESYIPYKLPDGQLGNMLDASKYLDILKNKIGNIKQTEQENKIKAQANKLFNSLKIKINKYSKEKKEATYKSLLSQLEKVAKKSKGDKLIIINVLIDGIKKEIGYNY